MENKNKNNNSKLIINGNEIYELDTECIQKKNTCDYPSHRMNQNQYKKLNKGKK